MNSNYVREDDEIDALIREANNDLDRCDMRTRIAKAVFWLVMVGLFVAWMMSWGHP